MNDKRDIIIGQTYMSIYDRLVYRVINIAYNPDTKQMMVVYEEHFGQHRVFCIDYNKFNSETPRMNPRNIEILYRYKMCDCDVDQHGSVTVRSHCLKENKEE